MVKISLLCIYNNAMAVFLIMQQQTKKTSNQQQGSKQTSGQPSNGSNVWDFNEFRKGTEAWSNAWQDMFAHNTNSEKWGRTFSEGNKSFTGWVGAWNQCSNTCSEATTEYTQAYMQKCSEGQNQAYSYANECSAATNKAYGKYNQMFQNAFNCRTYEQWVNWCENYTKSTQEITADACSQAAQATIDCQERFAQPMVKQVSNWQERCWKAWTKFAKSASNLG